MIKFSLFYGILGGISLLVLDLLFYNYLFQNISGLIIVLQLLLLAGALLLGIRQTRKHVYGGEISYKNASLTGFLITLYAAVILGATAYFFFPYGNEDFVAEYRKVSIEKLREQGISDQEIENNLEPMLKFFEKRNISQANFISTMLTGTILTLILSSFLRKRGNPDQFS